MNKNMINWFTKNIGTLFSFLGVIGTIYFGVFHIPSYLEDMKNEKIRNVQTGLIQNIQEMVYNDSITIEYKNIETFIQSKELKYQVKFPYSVNQLLSLTQESFMEQKYLPLRQRERIFQDLEKIKSKEKPITNLDKKEKSKLDYLSILIGFISIFISIIGVWGAIRNRSKVLKQEEDEKRVEIETTVKTYHDFEKTILNILINSENKFHFNDTTRKRDLGFDFLLEHENVSLIGEIKYYMEGQFLRTPFLERFYHLCQNQDKSGLIILNKELTLKERKLIEVFNSRGNLKIYTIVFVERAQLIRQIEEIINTAHNN